MNRYMPDEVEAERHRCPKNRLKEVQDKGRLPQKQGVQLILKPFKVEPLKLRLVEERDDKEVPELVSDLQEVDHQWLKMMAEYTAPRVTFL